jgi:hypothetical protein
MWYELRSCVIMSCLEGDGLEGFEPAKIDEIADRSSDELLGKTYDPKLFDVVKWLPKTDNFEGAIHSPLFVNARALGVKEERSGRGLGIKITSSEMFLLIN